MRVGRRKLLVPEARDALLQMKRDVTQTVQVSKPDASAADTLTTHEAGLRGGFIGGEMVRRLIAIAKSDLESK